MKQISLTLPEPLFELSTAYTQQFGYRTIQEFIVDLIRKKLLIEKTERYQLIEQRMKEGKGVKKFQQKEAKNYLTRF